MAKIASSLINRHVRKIEAALSSTRDAFFQLVQAIKEARDELGDEAFQKELAEQLSIPPSTLSKYLQIADCQLIMKRQKSLPPTLTTLYSLAQTHSKLVKAEGVAKANQSFQNILAKIDKTTEANDVLPFLKKAKEKLGKKAKQKREKSIFSLSETDTKVEEYSSDIVSFEEVFGASTRYRTIFIEPSLQVIKWASDNGVFASDINERYPIADLRTPSMKETVQGFVYCSADHLGGGLKILTAAGFEFRDIFCPSVSSSGFSLLRTEKILLRGERGVPSRPTMKGEAETSVAGALAIAEAIGSEPRLYVFATEAYENWTCANETKAR